MKKTLLFAFIAISSANLMAQGNTSELQSFRPGSINEYDWRSNTWNLSNTTNISYDSDGRVIAETGKYQKMEYEYDNNGMVIKQTVYNAGSNGEYTPAEKVEYTYDSIVTDFKTSAISYYWRDSTWQVSDGSRQVITRNGQGNITKIENQDLKNGEYVTANEYCEITYGTDDRAATIICYEEDDSEATPVWNISMKLTDIVWDKTDGQITDIYDSDDLTDFLQGNNRIKSATIAQGNYPGAAYMTVSYSDDGYGYDSRTTYGGEVVDYEKLTPLDSYGSYTLEAYYTDYDYDEDKATWENDGSYYYNETKMYDKFGLVLEDTEEDKDSTGKVSYGDYEKGEVTYDDATGMPAEYIVQKKYSNSSDYKNVEKYVYGDYAASAISIEGESQDTDVKYFNLNGMEINPSEFHHGIMIMRNGGENIKIIR